MTRLRLFLGSSPRTGSDEGLIEPLARVGPLDEIARITIASGIALAGIEGEGKVLDDRAVGAGGIGRLDQTGLRVVGALAERLKLLYRSAIEPLRARRPPQLLQNVFPSKANLRKILATQSRRGPFSCCRQALASIEIDRS